MDLFFGPTFAQGSLLFAHSDCIYMAQSASLFENVVSTYSNRNAWSQLAWLVTKSSKLTTYNTQITDDLCECAITQNYHTLIRYNVGYLCMIKATINIPEISKFRWLAVSEFQVYMRYICADPEIWNSTEVISRIFGQSETPQSQKLKKSGNISTIFESNN